MSAKMPVQGVFREALRITAFVMGNSSVLAFARTQWCNDH